MIKILKKENKTEFIIDTEVKLVEPSNNFTFDCAFLWETKKDYYTVCHWEEVEPGECVTNSHGQTVCQ